MLWEIQKRIKSGGYILAKVPDHPNAINGYVLEHRIIVENHLNRILRSDEVVHHKDFDKTNNSLDNLQVLSPSEHSILHGNLVGHMVVILKCPVCKREFKLRKNKSFLIKKTKYNCNCCNRSCKGKFIRSIQLNGGILTEDTLNSIKENFIEEKLEYLNDIKQECFLGNQESRSPLNGEPLTDKADGNAVPNY